MRTSLDIQIGGNHYKGLAYQPLQFSVDMCLNFIQGNIVKYVSRYKNKNGNEDLKKAMHYAQLGVELNPANFCLFYKVDEKVDEFIQKNKLTDTVGEIVKAVCYQDWIKVTAEVKKIYKHD